MAARLVFIWLALLGAGTLGYVLAHALDGPWLSADDGVVLTAVTAAVALAIAAIENAPRR